MDETKPRMRPVVKNRFQEQLFDEIQESIKTIEALSSFTKHIVKGHVARKICIPIMRVAKAYLGVIL